MSVNLSISELRIISELGLPLTRMESVRLGDAEKLNAEFMNLESDSLRFQYRYREEISGTGFSEEEEVLRKRVRDMISKEQAMKIHCPSCGAFCGFEHPDGSELHYVGCHDRRAPHICPMAARLSLLSIDEEERIAIELAKRPGVGYTTRRGQL